MNDLPKLRLGDRLLSIVRGSARVEWDEHRTRDELRLQMDDPVMRRQLLELADAMMCPHDGIDAVLAFLADACASGQLQIFAIDDGTAGLTPMWPGQTDADLDWDDIPYLTPDGPGRGPSPWEPDSPEPPARGDDPPSDVPSAPVQTFVAFTVVDQDGARLRGDFSCVVDGSVREGLLESSPSRFEPVDASASVTLAPTGYLSPTRRGPASVTEKPSSALELAPSLGPIDLPLGELHTIVVQVPKATVFTLPAYALDLEVFRPGWLWFDEATSEGTSGFGCLAQALAYAREHPERHLLVVGHTDTTGSKSHNRDLAQRRAEHLAALLRADCDAWTASCVADGELADLAAHLTWAAQRFGWACAAGPATKLTPELRAALAEYRRRAEEVLGIHVDPEQSPSEADWQLAYGMIDLALSEELDLDLAELAALRAGLRWCEPAIVGAGELWPRELVGKNGAKSAVNRRTEIMFATVPAIPGGAGSPEGDTLFGKDAWLWLDYIDPEPRAAQLLTLTSDDDHRVPQTPFRFASGGDRMRYGRFDDDGAALLLDVAAGDFRVHYLDHDDIAAKIWASRFQAAVAADDLAAARRVVGLPPAQLQAVAQVWSERYGGGQALADRARGLSGAEADVTVIDFLLAIAGFPGATEYDITQMKALPPKEASS